MCMVIADPDSKDRSATAKVDPGQCRYNLQIWGEGDCTCTRGLHLEMDPKSATRHGRLHEVPGIPRG